MPSWPSSGRRRHRGAIFLIALAVITILAAMLLVFGQEMRTESLAAANRLSAAQASAVETGAEQWVMAQCEMFTTPLSGTTGSNNVGVGQTDITKIPAAAVAVGDPAHGGGYFWCLSPNAANDQAYGYGIQDENAKVNLNVPASYGFTFTDLPGMTQEAADCITDWVDTDENTTGSDGAESDYYQSPPVGGAAEAHPCKNAPLDTVEELLLVKGVTPNMLWGSDLNRDGVIDPTEAQLPVVPNPAVTTDQAVDRRGFANDVTCYTTDNPPGQAAVAAPARPGVVAKKTVGLINLNTAPVAVITCLPGMSQATAQTLVDTRTQQNVDGSTSSLTWAQSALGGLYNAVQPYVTAQSYQYSADIVAVSGDGRAFKRVRIVVDVRTQPATIVYHKDITDLGWPLPPDVRTSLRAGQGIPPDAQATTTGGTGLVP